MFRFLTHHPSGKWSVCRCCWNQDAAGSATIRASAAAAVTPFMEHRKSSATEGHPPTLPALLASRTSVCLTCQPEGCLHLPDKPDNARRRNGTKQILAALEKSRRVQACLDLLAAFLRALPDPAPTFGTTRSPLPPPPPPPAEEKGTAQSGSGDVGGGGGGGGGAGDGSRRNEADVARALVGVAKLLHDSLDLLSSHERQRQASARVGLMKEKPSRINLIYGRPITPYSARAI